MKKLLQLSFIPCSADFALLVLRLWLGLTLFFNHGLGKLVNFSRTVSYFSNVHLDPIGIGATGTVAIAVLAEVVCAALLVVGVATRFVALFIALELAVAFFMVHHAALAMGPGSGELAFIYLAGLMTIVLAGGGRFVLCKQTNDVPVAPASS